MSNDPAKSRPIMPRVDRSCQESTDHAKSRPIISYDATTSPSRAELREAEGLACGGLCDGTWIEAVAHSGQTQPAPRCERRWGSPSNAQSRKACRVPTWSLTPTQPQTHLLQQQQGDQGLMG